MTDSDIIRLAEQAGINYRKNTEEFYSDFCDGISLDDIKKFAALLAAEIMPKETLAEMFEWGKDAGRHEEREACAEVCDDIHAEHEAKGAFSTYAEAIRARGENK